MQIQEVGLDVMREPLARPFGFKGGRFTEKWLCKVELRSESGKVATGIGGLAVLWSDPRVFHAHTEVGGNIVMVAMLEKALAMARGQSFETPLELLEHLIEPVHEYGKTITGNADLRRTFTLNSLVALDNAAWILYARERGIATFDQLIPAEFRVALGHRHSEVAVIPAVSYGMSVDEVVGLARAGCFVFKMKLGAPGDHEEMLAADMRRLTEIHQAIGDFTTRYTDDGKLRYYLDANGRYPHPDVMKRLLDHARGIGMMEQVLVLEEPFDESCDFPVHDLGVRVAVDESLHTHVDVEEKARQGYGALALKPAGKTLSMTLRMAREAVRLGIPCLVADSGCVPVLVEWNKNVAARLAPFPGLKTGLLESNGPQHYAHWRELIQAHPASGKRWVESAHGVFELDDEFFESGGGIFDSE